MISFPNAKINLGLNITEKRADGYHNLETVFYPIPLEDALEVVAARNARTKCTIHPSGHPIEGKPEDNLVAKAYRMLDEKFDLPPVDVYLYKHIPSGAGLGGGSADAAFMLKLLNETFALGLTIEELEHYAARLGADCAFFIRNQPTFAQGIGNVFSPVSVSLKGYRLVVVKPHIFVSTQAAFAQIEPRKPEHSLKEIVGLPVVEWKKWMKNDFEESVFPQYPKIKKIKESLYRQGALYASMSGSGSSVLGIFDHKIISTKKEEYADCFYFEQIL